MPGSVVVQTRGQEVGNLFSVRNVWRKCPDAVLGAGQCHQGTCPGIDDSWNRCLEASFRGKVRPDAVFLIVGICRGVFYQFIGNRKNRACFECFGLLLFGRSVFELIQG